MNEKGWSFPRNDFGQRQGISDSGVETFKGAPIRALAREISQNSLDAGQEGKTVVLEFEFFRMSAHKFPGLKDLDEALYKSFKTWEYQKHDKTKDFIKGARKLLKQDKIPFLRVSDYNTLGLQGSNQRGSDWDNLVKSSGSSDKSSDAGGSYGIGKFAPFACSNLRTVFYATKDIEGNEATQGIARLVSHKIDLNKDEETQGTGFYGVKNKHQPMMEYFSLQENFNRDETGTDIFIAGFNKDSDWKTLIIREVLDSFLYAIYKGEFIVRIDNKVELNRQSLPMIIYDYHDNLSRETIDYYNVLVSENTSWYEEDIKGLGNVELGLQVNDQFDTKRVAMIRNPWMKIYDQGRISSTTPFAGLLIVKGRQLNELLRKMENPKHDNWEPERLEENMLINEGKIVKRRLRRLIIDKLENLMMSSNEESLDVEGAGDYIPLEDDDAQDTSNIDDYLNPKVVETEVKEIENIYNQQNNKDTDTQQETKEMIEGGIIDEGDEAYINISDNKNKRGEEPQEGDYGVNIDQDKEGKAYQIKTVKPKNINLMVINRQENKYRLVLSTETPLHQCSLKIFKMDEQGKKAKINILQAQSPTNEVIIKNNSVHGFDLDAYKDKIIDFQTDEKNYFSAEVELVGVKK